MNLRDSNVWLALVFADHTSHTTVLEWFDSLTEPGTALFCRATQQALLRLLTTPVVLAAFGRPPLTNREAWNLYESLFTDDRIALHHREPAELERHWMEFVVRDTSSPKLWMDAYLAAFAKAAGHRLVTVDKAFSQFAGLDLVLLKNPNP